MIITNKEIKNAKQLCWEFLNAKHPRKVTMRTPHWNQTLMRPIRKGNQCILSYEIYKIPYNPSERDTINALNELVREEKADVYTGAFVWYHKL